MSPHEPIIDVTPTPTTNATPPSGSETFRAPSYGSSVPQPPQGAPFHTAQTPNQVVNATIIEDATAGNTKQPSIISAAVQTVAGGALVLVGIPMLILPGPGLLAIGGGAVLATRGVKRLLGK